MSVEYWWNDPDKTSRNTRGKLSSCLFMHHKSYMAWSGTETWSLEPRHDRPKPRTQYLKYKFVRNQLRMHMDHKTGFMVGDGDEETS